MLRITLIIAVLVFAASTHADSLCDTYGSSKGTADYQLVSAVVNGTLGAVTGDDSLLRYFNGTVPVGSTNYITNVDALNGLREHLIQFFGGALGCADGTISAYMRANMSVVHANIPIGITQFNLFNNYVISVLNSSGVTMADQATVLSVLNSLKPQICNQPNCYPDRYTSPSICDKYAIALSMTDYDLVDYVVVKVLTNITTNPPTSPLLKYFNGAIPGTIDYTTNTGALAILHQHLTQFFGSALGCSASNYPAYQGQSLKQSHQNLPITKADFDYFNVILLDILSAAGVTSTDRASVLNVLNGTQNDVCTNCATPTPAPAPASSVGATILPSLFAAVFPVVVSTYLLL